MIIRSGLVTCKEGADMNFFYTYWHDVHGPLAAKMPFLRRYDQNHVFDKTQRSPAARSEINFDGFSELYFDDVYDMNESFRLMAGKDFGDLNNFCLPVTPAITSVRKMIAPLKEGKTIYNQIKAVIYCGRADGTTETKFDTHFCGAFADAMAKTADGCNGIFMGTVVEHYKNGVSKHYNELPVAGIVELYFDDMAQLEAYYASEGYLEACRIGASHIGTMSDYLIKVHPIMNEED